MAIESRAAVDAAPSAIVNPIENEMPAYRAISPLAVTSLILGLGSVLCFAYPWFAALGVLGVALGLLALRKIRRFPDMLTGRGIAQTGIVLGLLFTIASLTFVGVRTFKIRQEGDRFARRYAELLGKRDLATAAWYRVEPMARANLQPQEALADFTAQSDPMMIEANLGAIKTIHERIEKTGKAPRYVGVEESGYDGLTPYVFSLIAVPPAPHEHSEGEAHEEHEAEEAEQFALIELRSSPDSRAFDWYVSEIVFPYKPGSYELKVKPVDDGHGHSH